MTTIVSTLQQILIILQLSKEETTCRGHTTTDLNSIHHKVHPRKNCHRRCRHRPSSIKTRTTVTTKTTSRKSTRIMTKPSFHTINLLFVVFAASSMLFCQAQESSQNNSNNRCQNNKDQNNNNRNNYNNNRRSGNADENPRQTQQF